MGALILGAFAANAGSIVDNNITTAANITAGNDKPFFIVRAIPPRIRAAPHYQAGITTMLPKDERCAAGSVRAASAIGAMPMRRAELIREGKHLGNNAILIAVDRDHVLALLQHHRALLRAADVLHQVVDSLSRRTGVIVDTMHD